MTLSVVKKPCTPMVGADVEGFVYDLDTGMHIPAVGLLGGTKEAPEPLDKLPKGFAVQEDNVMAEFNIPPAANYNKFTVNMRAAVQGVKELLSNKYTDRSLTLSFVPDVRFSAKDLDSPQAKLIGCEPDCDAYQGGNLRDGVPELTNWRSAGGHIHLGGDFQCPDFVAALFADACIGLCANAVGMSPTKRADWYGKPGIFRPKSYGIEYRSPNCMWADRKDTTMLVGAMAQRLARWLTETDAKDLQATFRRINWKDVRTALTYDPTITYDEMIEFRNNVRASCEKAGIPV